MSPAEKLPPHIRAKALPPAALCVWRLQDVEETIRAAQQAGLATVYGQALLYLPEGTCDLYWLEFKPMAQRKAEAWAAFVMRSAEECVAGFRHLCDTKDFVAEAANQFQFLKERTPNEIMTGVVFELYFETEESYAQPTME